jgi:tRNA threonylcarbamoyladenosine biosynthesis protein TsaB
VTLVLAVDTTQEHGSIALVRDGALLEEVTIHSPSGFAHVLYGHLRDLLDRCDVRLGEIDLFAAAAGPGSFTGVRVGLACVKGLAEAMSKPAAAVSNLQALATFGTARLRAPVIDARRGEIYGAVYDDAGTLVIPEVVAKFDEWRLTIPSEAELIGNDPPKALAAAVARLAPRQARDPAALDANYVRRSDAELFWKE